MRVTKIIITVIMITSLLLGCSGESNVGIVGENDIMLIEQIFACGNIEVLASEFPEDITSYDDLDIEKNFAGIKGYYNVSIHDDGSIWRVSFTWDSNDENVEVQEVVDNTNELIENNQLFEITYYEDGEIVFGLLDSEIEEENEDDIVSSYDASESSLPDHYCEVSGCYSEGTYSIEGISGLTEYYCSEHYNEMNDTWNDMVEDTYDYSDDSYDSYSYDDDYGEGYDYDPSDPYYSANDHNGDGKLTDEEWQDAMSDALEDYSYLFEE